MVHFREGTTGGISLAQLDQVVLLSAAMLAGGYDTARQAHSPDEVRVLHDDQNASALEDLQAGLTLSIMDITRNRDQPDKCWN